MGCSPILTLVIILSCIGLLGTVIGEIRRKKWWQDTVIYQIYPQSFYDSDGDGYGDLNGITAKVDYLRGLEIGAVWINPIYESPLKDNGYDISNFRAIHPRFGTMRDFKVMVNALKRNSIELIMDFVPNHTSDQHEWFQKSVKEIAPYSDYYIWADAKGWENDKPIPPSNWESIFKAGEYASAWTWNDEREQFYYHVFMVEQPDLNLRNPKVVQEMKDIMKFWLDEGVKGFRLDAAPQLFEDEQLKDQKSGEEVYTKNLPEVYELVEDLRAYLDEYGRQNNIDVLLATEGYTGKAETLRYYGDTKKPGAHFPFNFLLIGDLLTGETSAPSLNDTISTYMKDMGGIIYPNWVSGNHDTPRIQSRMGGAFSAVDVVNSLALLLPGTATVYMGDEIGMDSYKDLDQSECPAGVGSDFRTPARTPFQWSADRNAGFTLAKKPWVPIHPDYYRVNTEFESKANNDRSWSFSPLENFQKMTAMKRLPAFTDGKLQTYVINDKVFAFTRLFSKQLFVILMNLGKAFSEPFSISDSIPITQRSYLVYAPVKSVNMAKDCFLWYRCARKILSKDFVLPPMSVIVLEYRSYPNSAGRRNFAPFNRDLSLKILSTNFWQ